MLCHAKSFLLTGSMSRGLESSWMQMPGDPVNWLYWSSIISLHQRKASQTAKVQLFSTNSNCFINANLEYDSNHRRRFYYQNSCISSFQIKDYSLLKLWSLLWQKHPRRPCWRSWGHTPACCPSIGGKWVFPSSASSFTTT